ncbi:hypothetical protein [Niallia nealsonii]|uniref:Uncharacterized protein n=1 Tax=Niallia nealsonii TaxID=115979 RepID=A0A2N0Z035_9BACI|nr:hypothetical protein [Niallia nealsonii]PKG22871.1 hypothetical protein CWS01_14405 [Niallia nealsonii]
MIIRIEFCYEADTEYMICPAKVGKNIRQLQHDFDKWLYDKNNNHPYWEIVHVDEDGNKKYGVYFNAEAFVYWMNNRKFKKGKKVARLIESPNKPPKKTIRF